MSNKREKRGEEILPLPIHLPPTVLVSCQLPPLLPLNTAPKCLFPQITAFQVSVCASASNMSNKLVLLKQACPSQMLPVPSSTGSTNSQFQFQYPPSVSETVLILPHYLYLFLLLLCALVLFYLLSVRQH